MEVARGHCGEAALGPPGWGALPGRLGTAPPAEPHHLGTPSRTRPPGTHLQSLFPVFFFVIGPLALDREWPHFTSISAPVCKDLPRPQRGDKKYQSRWTRF